MPQNKIISDAFRSKLTSNLSGLFYKYLNDSERTVLFISGDCETLTGYKSEELTNNKITPFGSLIHLEDRNNLRKDFTKNLNEISNYRIFHKSGSIKWIKEIANGVFDENGNLLYIEGYLEDQTPAIGMDSIAGTFSAFQNAINNASIVSITDIKGNIIYVNENFSYYSKYSLQELIGQNHSLVNSGYHPKSFFQDLWQTISKGKTWRGEICNRAKDGSNYWVDTVITPVFGKNKYIEQYLSIRNIITDKKKTEYDLQKSEERFELAMEGSNDGLWDRDLVSNSLYLSPRWLNIIGYKPGELKLHFDAFKILIHPEDKDRFHKTLENYLAGKSKEYIIEFRVLHKNNFYIDVLSRGKVIKDSEGNNYRMIGTLTDISFRKKTENALIKSEYQLKKVFESVTDVIYTISTEGKFLTLNKAFEKITGWEVENWIGKSFVNLVHPEDLNLTLNTFQKVFNGEFVDAYELRIKIKSGKYIYTEITSSALVENGIITSSLGIARDISFRKETEFKWKLIYETISVKTGMNYFSNLTKYCCDNLGVKFASIGIYLQDEEAIQTLSFRSKNKIFENHIYKINNTPSQKVIKMEGFIFLENIQQRFPFDEDLKKHGIESYMGYPLLNEEDEILGIISLMDNKPITDAAEKENILSFVLARTANEISRHMAENKLEESEEFNKGILSSLTSSIAVLNKNGDIISVNKAWTNFSETNGETILSRTGIGSNYYKACEAAIKAGDAITKKAVKGIKAVMNKELPFFQMEYPCNSNDVERWFIMSVSLFESSDPKVVVRHIDITERRKTESRLERSEKNYRELVENSQDIVFSIDKTGKFLFTNKYCQSILKYTSEELNKLEIFDLIQEDHHDQYLKHIGNVLSGKKDLNVESVFITKKKKTIFVEGSSAPVISNGEIIGIQSFFRDVTQRKKTELELIRSEHRYKNVVENINDAIIIRNIKGVITFANQRFLELLGLEKKDVIGVNMEDYIASGWKAEMKKQYLKIINSDENPEVYEYQGMRSDGATLWLEDKITLLHENGKITGTQAVIRDITELKKKENDLKKLINELTNRNNEMMQFNYIVSHNLRAPIANIIGLSNLLNIEDSTQKERKTILEHIKSSSFKMDEMIKDLSIVLNTRSNLNAKKEKILFHNIFHSIRETLEEPISTSNCKLKLDIAPDANEIFTIKSYMESILFNLISNAIKYRSLKRVLHINIIVRKENNKTLISVSDNGIGINLKENGAYIFGLYKRFNYEVEGKGLGLHMTKAQVEALGGKITVESELDKGTHFKIEFPN